MIMELMMRNMYKMLEMMMDTMITELAGMMSTSMMNVPGRVLVGIKMMISCEVGTKVLGGMTVREEVDKVMMMTKLKLRNRGVVDMLKVEVLDNVGEIMRVEVREMTWMS